MKIPDFWLAMTILTESTGSAETRRSTCDTVGHSFLDSSLYVLYHMYRQNASEIFNYSFCFFGTIFALGN
jgi:hypothetical protein